MRGEQFSMVASREAVDPVALAHSLATGGLRLRGDPGLISYATSCPFRGAKVPHLVVQTDLGPVTVLVLRHVPVDQPREFREQGYTGTIAPFGRGSIAVIGESLQEADDVATRLRMATEWVDD